MARSPLSVVGQNIAIIGPGRLGQALGRLLAEAGFPIRLVAARRLSAARRAARFIGSGHPVGLNSPELPRASVIFITTSDAAVAPVAERLAALSDDWSGRVVLHTSGSLPASVLAPFKKRGAAIGSLHPFQTIPSPAAGVQNLRNGYWAIEGDPEALRLAKRVVKALGGVAFLIPAANRVLYHAAAFVVCPTIVTLMDWSARLLARSKVPHKVIRPMLYRFVAETIKNFADFGGPKSLTGPAARGDWPVLRRHLAELHREFPDTVPLYKELVRAMIRLAGKRAPRGLL
ncbi:MAG: Rossmann-like and DUF2520 domain-containing protein [Terriglobia bacterium]